MTVKWSDVVLVPSQKAVEYYSANPLYKNDNVYCLPFMYDDERTEKQAQWEREFFGYIGTVAADHSFNEYLKFVSGHLATIANLLESKVPYRNKI